MPDNDLTKDELLARAREQGIEGRSAMTKQELEEAVNLERPPSGNLRQPNGNWFHDHLLSLSLASLFLLAWLGQLYFQYRHEIDEAIQHGEERPEFFSGEFWTSFLASTLENWQSEFLQLLTFVVLAAYLIHRDSPRAETGTTKWPPTSRRFVPSWLPDALSGGTAPDPMIVSENQGRVHRST